jgi:hypothetical protein
MVEFDTISFRKVEMIGTIRTFWNSSTRLGSQEQIEK